MSIAFPDHTGIANVTMRMVNTTAISTSPFTGVQQTQSYPNERWEADVTLPPMRRADAALWCAWLASLRGRAGTFTMGDPLSAAPTGTATSATVTGAAEANEITVTMTGTLLAGDYIQIGVGYHMVLADQDGNGTLSIWPALRASVTDVAAVLTGAVGTFRLMSDENGWNVNSASQYGITFSAHEAY